MSMFMSLSRGLKQGTVSNEVVRCDCVDVFWVFGAFPCFLRSGTFPPVCLPIQQHALTATIRIRSEKKNLPGKSEKAETLFKRRSCVPMRITRRRGQGVQMGCGASSPASGSTPLPPQAAAGRVNPPPPPQQGGAGLQRAKSVKLSALVNRKLEDPNLILTLDEQLDVLRECIERGAAHAATAAGKEPLVIIGNTGAGKSTCINYVDGCKLVKGFLDETSRKKVVRVAPDSPRPQLMIGHSDKSQTFVPDVRVGCEFVYCDCRVSSTPAAPRSTSPTPSTSRRP